MDDLHDHEGAGAPTRDMSTLVDPCREAPVVRSSTVVRRDLIARIVRRRDNARRLDAKEQAEAIVESGLVPTHCGNEREDKGNFK